MQIADLIAALSQPAAYRFPVGEIIVHQTHISAVFLTGDFAFKIKKPVALGFLDFSSLEKRRYYCDEEVRLNRRLAPSVYLGVVPVTRTGASFQMEGDGEVVEWAVKMTRLPDDATLERRLDHGLITPELMNTLAARISGFHATAATGPHSAEFGRYEMVARNARENFEQSQRQIGATVSATVHQRLRELTEHALRRLEPIIERRAEHGLIRDTHGDLHLDHVYLFPDRPPPDDLVVIDCIEFNERFRFADPVADMAFLVMDLLFHGRADLADAFAAAYFRASGDNEGRTLLSFYVAYRAIVRGKVEGLELAETEIPAAEREAASARAQAHWLLALAQLEVPERRPGLILIAGLPGTGKSTLAQNLVDRAGFALLRSDVVRKELAGLPATAAVKAPFGENIYTPEWTERTYAECLRRSRAWLFEGIRVLIDANFREEKWRRAFLDAAAAWRVPATMLLCQADPEMVRQRLATRHGDASDADWSIHQQLAATWQPLGKATSAEVVELRSDGDANGLLNEALAVLGGLGLMPTKCGVAA